MKKSVAILLTIGLLLPCTVGCSKKKAKTKDKEKSKVKTEATDENGEPIVEIETSAPSITTVRSICQLATTDCYYHNVCKGVKSAGTGLSHLGEQDREFWFEYSAEATIGIDVSQVEIVIDKNEITVYYPHAQIIGDIRVDADSTTTPICEEEGFFQNSNYITADDVTSALVSANDEIRAGIEADPYIFKAAENRAEELLENYINQLMAQSGKKYTIKFAYVESKTQ